MTRLRAKIIVVTGASSGLGRGIAKACASQRAKLVSSFGERLTMSRTSLFSRIRRVELHPRQSDQSRRTVSPGR